MKRLHCFLVWALLLAGWLGGTAYGQNAQVDKDRMERDIDIMEKVLNELFKNAAGNRSQKFYLSSSRTAQGSYVPGYGVLFIAPAYSGSFGVKNAYNYVYSSGGTNRTVVVTEGDWKGTMSYTGPSDEDKDKDKGEKQKEKTGKNAPQAPDRARRLSNVQDSILQAHTNLVTTNMREFLANYADAIGQLAPNDRVMIIYNENARNDHYESVRACETCETRTMPRISAEVKREDLTAFRSGKMSRKELDSRIRVNADNPGKENYAEYKVFAGILESLYPVSREVPYRVRNIGYHVLPSFGVIYLVDMGLRNESPNVVTIRDGEVRKTKTERDSAQARIRTEAYGQFRNDIREAVLDYGRTLRNLSSDQVILLSVALPTCEGCNVPPRANVSVKKSVLEAYEQNKMNRQQALEAITVGEK
ncbi:MAG: hypothetical protein ICV83_04695 [Cytophagales bacterium]|nr:hypothetical protein [Cytophagales bacterium]